MSELREQRYAVKFCVRLGKTATETFQMMRTAYGDYCMSRAARFRWHKAFKDGRESCELQGGLSATNLP